MYGSTIHSTSKKDTRLLKFLLDKLKVEYEAIMDPVIIEETEVFKELVNPSHTETVSVNKMDQMEDQMEDATREKINVLPPSQSHQESVETVQTRNRLKRKFEDYEDESCKNSMLEENSKKMNTTVCSELQTQFCEKDMFNFYSANDKDNSSTS